MTSRAQKMYKKLLDPEPSRRLSLSDIDKYLEDRWLRKGVSKLEDEQSQLTLGSFQVIRRIIYFLDFPCLNFRVFIPIYVRRTVYCTHYFSMVILQGNHQSVFSLSYK